MQKQRKNKIASEELIHSEIGTLPSGDPILILRAAGAGIGNTRRGAPTPAAPTPKTLLRGSGAGNDVDRGEAVEDDDAEEESGGALGIGSGAAATATKAGDGTCAGAGGSGAFGGNVVVEDGAESGGNGASEIVPTLPPVAFNGGGTGAGGVVVA